MNYTNKSRKVMKKLEKETKKYFDKDFKLEIEGITIRYTEGGNGDFEYVVEICFFDEIYKEYHKEKVVCYKNEQVCGAFLAGYIEHILANI